MHSFSIAELARPPSSAWLFGLTQSDKCVGDARDRVRGLKHLAGVLRMIVGVVVLHALGHFREHGGSGFSSNDGVKSGRSGCCLPRALPSASRSSSSSCCVDH